MTATGRLDDFPPGEIVIQLEYHDLTGAGKAGIVRYVSAETHKGDIELGGVITEPKQESDSLSANPLVPDSQTTCARQGIISRTGGGFLVVLAFVVGVFLLLSLSLYLYIGRRKEGRKEKSVEEFSLTTYVVNQNSFHSQISLINVNNENSEREERGDD